MAARRGKSQARRSGGNSGGLPGWAWLVIGVLLALLAMLVLPRYFKPAGEDGFFRPRPNPDAQPAISAIDEDLPPPPGSQAADPVAPPAPARPEYDFYTVLPEQEVAMTDAQLAATAREEAERRRRLEQARQAQAPAHPDAAEPAHPAPIAEQPAPQAPAAGTATTPPATTAPSPATTASAAPAADGTRYILQAGAFSSSGDAEALKARIALLGLTARVETGDVEGRTVHRVRMGPYATATELAEAKQKLGNGGLPALAIRAN
ncbi:sporulation protein [Luteimonas aestuarii]|uniref:Sporulation protein n=1 Tax=Luteimonas aestuarii TaxID=453837 RepID=A0A4R5TSH1_9GAMM|nr:SPOR domain-containing protein [Luteimonas aestuarii]TDK23144.1 sporulation protein [Luteimonas aestuarii]